MKARLTAGVGALVLAATGIGIVGCSRDSTSGCDGNKAATTRMEQLARDPAAALAFLDPTRTGQAPRIAGLLTRHLPAGSGLSALPSCASVGDALQAAAVGTSDVPSPANGAVAREATRVLGDDLDAKVPAPMRHQITTMFLAYAPFGDLVDHVFPNDTPGHGHLANAWPLMTNLAGDPREYGRLLAAVVAYSARWTDAGHGTEAKRRAVRASAQTIGRLVYGVTHPESGARGKLDRALTTGDVAKYLLTQPRPVIADGKGSHLPDPRQVASYIAATNQHFDTYGSSTIPVTNLHDENEDPTGRFYVQLVTPDLDEEGTRLVGGDALTSYEEGWRSAAFPLP